MSRNTGGLCVILRGGPRHGWVYFEKDIEHQRRAAERTGGKFPYVPTEQLEDGVVANGRNLIPNSVAKVWRWRP